MQDFIRKIIILRKLDTGPKIKRLTPNDHTHTEHLIFCSKEIGLDEKKCHLWSSRTQTLFMRCLIIGLDGDRTCLRQEIQRAKPAGYRGREGGIRGRICPRGERERSISPYIWYKLDFLLTPLNLCNFNFWRIMLRENDSNRWEHYCLTFLCILLFGLTQIILTEGCWALGRKNWGR